MFGREAVRSTGELPRLTSGRAEETYASAEAANGMDLVDGTGAAAGALGRVAAHHASGAPTATATISASHLHGGRRAADGTRPGGNSDGPEGPAALFRRMPKLRGAFAGSRPRVFSDSGFGIISAG